jgi:hypothetical protein
MNKDYIQNLRYKLQKRVRKLNSITDPEYFHFGVLQFWGFLMSQPVFVGIVEALKNLRPQDDGEAKKIIDGGEALIFELEIEHVAVAYFVLCRVFNQKIAK